MDSKVYTVVIVLRGLFFGRHSFGNFMEGYSAAFWRGSSATRDPCTGQMLVVAWMLQQLINSYNSYNIGSCGTSLEGGIAAGNI